ncbi:hypothetical protein [Streptomyces sp. NPDC006193]|uniref:hypothetical protein n=1 Tax=Streptomyces sp. NPDC006193 TaxID=3155717 RepID=UPI0033B7E212
MKSLKAAAVVAGSVALAGVAAPAFAYDAHHLPPMSVNGALSHVAEHPPTVDDLLPVKQQSNALDTENKNSVLGTVKGATTDLNKRRLLGGLPLQH